MQADDVDDEDATLRDALRLPDPLEAKEDAGMIRPSPSEPDLFVPIIVVGSFACFAVIIANEYLTRGFCPPFLSTCLFGADNGGWG